MQDHLKVGKKRDAPWNAGVMQWTEHASIIHDELKKQKSEDRDFDVEHAIKNVEVNGKKGIADRWNSSRERWEVRFQDGDTKVIKPENLVIQGEKKNCVETNLSCGVTSPTPILVAYVNRG